MKYVHSSYFYSGNIRLYQANISKSFLHSILAAIYLLDMKTDVWFW